MRIAAGVLLIIASIFNMIGGFTYGVTGAAKGAVAEGADQIKVTSDTMTDEEKKKMEEQMKAAAKDAGEGAGSTFILGIFLFVVFGLQIGGAVTLFMSKAAGFVLVVGLLGIVAEVAGPVMYPSVVSFGFMNIIGLVASVLAILASRGYAGKAAVA